MYSVVFTRAHNLIRAVCSEITLLNNPKISQGQWVNIQFRRNAKFLSFIEQHEKSIWYKTFIYENAFENVACKMAAILSWGTWVNRLRLRMGALDHRSMYHKKFILYLHTLAFIW